MKLFNYTKLLQEHNTLKNKYEVLNNNFMRSSYKHILDFEGQQRLIEELRDKNKSLTEKIKEMGVK